jgi:hypothetical protein
MEVLDREPFAIVEDVIMAIGLRKDLAEKACAIARLQELYAVQIPPTEVPDLRFPIPTRILTIEDSRQVFREVFPQEVPEVLIRVNVLFDILFRFSLVLRDDAFFQLLFLLIKAESHLITDRLVPAEQLFVPATEGLEDLRTGLVPLARESRVLICRSLTESVTGKVPDPAFRSLNPFRCIGL